MIFVELALLLLCIVIGARVGGIGLGTVAGADWTRIGRYVLYYGFMLPGLVTTISAIAIGFGIASLT